MYTRMKTLPFEFDFIGMRLKQIHREGNIAIYKKSIGDDFIYEVIRIRENEEGREVYPNANEHGENLWTFYGFDCLYDAEIKFKRLLKEAGRKKVNRVA